MSRLTVPVNERDHVRGSPSARVIMLEYGDYECPHCGAAHPVVKQIERAMGDALAFVFRNFPLTEVHRHALHAAFAAEAATFQDKFWEMHDSLFENQDALEDEDLLEYARRLGLDIDQLAQDFLSDEVADKVEQDFRSGVRSGVNGTPTFFINGVRYDGSYDYPSLLAAVQEELAPARRTPPGARQPARPRQRIRVRGR